MIEHPDNTTQGLLKLAPVSPTARYLLERRQHQPLRLSRRPENAAAQLVEELGLIETRRWLNHVLDEISESW